MCIKPYRYRPIHTALFPSLYSQEFNSQVISKSYRIPKGYNTTSLISTQRYHYVVWSNFAHPCFKETFSFYTYQGKIEIMLGFARISSRRFSSFYPPQPQQDSATTTIQACAHCKYIELRNRCTTCTSS